MKNLNMTEKMILNLVNKTNLIPFLKGPHGIGKTSLVKQLAEKLDKTLFIFNLSAVDSADLTGLPINEKTDKGTVLKYSRPHFFDYGIIFFDELDRVKSSDVKAALNSLFVDRSINGHRLGKETVLIAAGNQDSDKYETIDFDPSLMDRLAMIDFSVSVRDRISYFKKTLGESNPMTLFIESRPEMLEAFSPRRLFQAASLFQDENYKQDDSILVTLESVLNRETTRIFNSFLNDGLINFDSLKSGQVNFDSLTVLTRMSCVNLIVSKLESIASKSENLNEAEVSNLVDFILELSPEEKASYFSKIKSDLLEGKITKENLKTLNELGLFKGQKQFLKELI